MSIPGSIEWLREANRGLSDHILEQRRQIRRLRKALDQIGEAIAKGWTHDALVISEEALHPPRETRRKK